MNCSVVFKSCIREVSRKHFRISIRNFVGQMSLSLFSSWCRSTPSQHRILTSRDCQTKRKLNQGQSLWRFGGSCSVLSYSARFVWPPILSVGAKVSKTYLPWKRICRLWLSSWLLLMVTKVILKQVEALLHMQWISMISEIYYLDSRISSKIVEILYFVDINFVQILASDNRYQQIPEVRFPNRRHSCIDLR